MLRFSVCYARRQFIMAAKQVLTLWSVISCLISYLQFNVVYFITTLFVHDIYRKTPKSTTPMRQVLDKIRAN